MPRLIELRTEPLKESKAAAVNPRTLDLLGPTGIANRMLELGKPIRGVYFYRGTQREGHFELAGVHPKYPFMLGLSQATTERLLTEAVQQAGITIERGRNLVACRPVDGHVEATIEAMDGSGQELVDCPWLLAADGARSVVRQQMEIDFKGSSLPDDWHLADVPLRTALPEDHGHAYFLPQGDFLFMIRVIDEAMQQRAAETNSAAPIWRVISNRPEPLSRLHDADSAGPPLWASSFHISHRIDATFSKEGVYFAGDAAHIHSPVGARGMNLGIEDAWVFAELAAAGRLADYDALRRPVDRAVVRRVETLSEMIAAQSPLEQFARGWLLPLALKIPPLRNRVIRVATGLDHPLPLIPIGKSGDAAARDLAKRHPTGSSAVGA
jgi:2-polyprenyl-6-methoxyphenol hydroxylase-like FAD-dependent oxidoreductase